MIDAEEIVGSPGTLNTDSSECLLNLGRSLFMYLESLFMPHACMHALILVYSTGIGINQMS